MVCTQCGAVVGLNYKHDAPASGFATPTPAARGPSAFPAPLAGATRGLPARVKAILASPRAEWRVIAGEPTSAVDVWASYVIPLALIGPIALAVAQVAFGTVYPLVGLVKVSLVTGIATALLSFAFALVQVFVLSRIVNMLALKFHATPDPLAALKVVAYSMTPIWLVGIVYLLPVLGFLWVLAALYAVLLAFLGLQSLMECPPPKALAYTFAVMGVAFGLWVATGAIVTALMGFGPVMLE